MLLKLLIAVLFSLSITKCTWGQTWYIEGATEKNKKKIEETAAQIKGVESVLLNLSKKTLSLRPSSSESILTETVKSALDKIDGVKLGKRIASAKEDPIESKGSEFPPEKIPKR